MKTLAEVYSPRNRGPWSLPQWLQALAGERETRIMGSRQCEAFPHHLNRDCDFYVSDGCITYYCPVHGAFTVDVKNSTIIS